MVPPVQIVVVDDEECETERRGHVTDRAHELQEPIEGSDDCDFWLVCAVDRAERPDAEQVEWIHVGRPE